jgi:hypothetical protein
LESRTSRPQRLGSSRGCGLAIGASQGVCRNPRRRRLAQDFGATWSKPCYGKRGPGKVRCLTIDPRDPNTIYAGTEPIDVFISRDGAKSWKRLDSVWNIPSVSTITYPVATVEPHVRDITIDPQEPNTMYVALRGLHDRPKTAAPGSLE